MTVRCDIIRKIHEIVHLRTPHSGHAVFVIIVHYRAHMANVSYVFDVSMKQTWHDELTDNVSVQIPRKIMRILTNMWPKRPRPEEWRFWPSTAFTGFEATGPFLVGISQIQGCLLTKQSPFVLLKPTYDKNIQNTGQCPKSDEKYWKRDLACIRSKGDHLWEFFSKTWLKQISLDRNICYCSKHVNFLCFIHFIQEKNVVGPPCILRKRS